MKDHRQKEERQVIKPEVIYFERFSRDSFEESEVGALFSWTWLFEPSDSPKNSAMSAGVDLKGSDILVRQEWEWTYFGSFSTHCNTKGLSQRFSFVAKAPNFLAKWISEENVPRLKSVAKSICEEKIMFLANLLWKICHVAFSSPKEERFLAFASTWIWTRNRCSAVRNTYHPRHVRFQLQMSNI